MYFAIIGVESGKALDASGSDLGEVILWDFHGGENQLWYFEGDVLRNKAYQDRVLDFHWGDFERNDWGKVYLHNDFHGGHNQRWQMLRNGEIVCKGFANQVRHDLRLDVFESSIDNGARVGVYHANGQKNQAWTIRNV